MAQDRLPIRHLLQSRRIERRTFLRCHEMTASGTNSAAEKLGEVIAEIRIVNSASGGDRLVILFVINDPLRGDVAVEPETSSSYRHRSQFHHPGQVVGTHRHQRVVPCVADRRSDSSSIRQGL